MGTLEMTELEVEVEQQIIRAEIIDWSEYDTDPRRDQYETQDPLMVIPHVVYHFLGPPINKLFPSTDNIKQFCAEGIYFNENYFLELTWDEDASRFDAQIVTPKIGNIFQVTYSPKFIGKRLLVQNKYFGFKHTNSTNFVNYNRNYNFTQREAPDKIDVSWLSNYVNLLNEDAIEDKNIYCSIPNSRRPAKNFNGFHDQMQAFANDQSSVLFQFLNGEETNEDLLRMKGEWLERKGKGKGRGYPKGKGYFQGSFNPYQVVGQYDKGKSVPKGFQKGSYEPKGKGVSYNHPQNASPFNEFVNKSCFIVEDDSVYRYSKEKGLSKISISEISHLKQSIDEIETLLLVLQDKRELLKSRIKSSEKVQDDSIKEEEKPKPRDKTKKDSKEDSSSGDDTPEPASKPSKEKSKDSSDSSDSEVIKMKRKKVKKKKKSKKVPKSEGSDTSDDAEEDKPRHKHKTKKVKGKGDK